MHSVVADSEAKYPEEQLAQSTEPGMLLKVPRGHAEQSLDPAVLAKRPEVQFKQVATLDTDALDKAEFHDVPAKQARHLDFVLAPGVRVTKPSSQKEGVWEPSRQYLPRVHSIGEPSGQ
jgi:hypothetical protein